MVVINLLHMKHALEVARAGSLAKASETLMVAAPNISRSIKELESDLGIVIFDRARDGMKLTPDGEEFINYARSIIGQLDEVENFYKNGAPKKQKFSISVPRASYIADAFAEFSKTISTDAAEIFYKETNSQRTLHYMNKHDYKLGIIRYAENYDRYFEALLEEKGFVYETVTEFTYALIMSRENPLARKETVTYDDLRGSIEIAHADPYVPSLPLSKVIKEELPDNIDRRIFVFERCSQFELLNRNAETFMWASPAPQDLLDRYQLVQKKCVDNQKVYKDVLIYKKGYRLSELDRRFIAALYAAKTQYIK